MNASARRVSHRGAPLYNFNYLISGSHKQTCLQTFVLLLRGGISVNYPQKKRSKSGAQEERYPVQNAEGSNSSAIKKSRVVRAFVGVALVSVQMAASLLDKEQGKCDRVFIKRPKL